jgi:hypothetical protein
VFQSNAFAASIKMSRAVDLGAAVTSRNSRLIGLRQSIWDASMAPRTFTKENISKKEKYHERREQEN